MGGSGGGSGGGFEGTVALVTGAARGQGRSHAVALAREGADVVLLDRCAPLAGVPYDLASPADLVETVRQVEARGRRAVAHQVDVRDGPATTAAVADGVARLGRLDVVVANAGVTGYARAQDLTDQQWDAVVGTVLTGTFRTVRAAVPHLRVRGGSVVITSSTEGLQAVQHMAHYTAAKHGLVGLARTLALELAADGIRVNTVHPTSTDTAMIHNRATYALFRPDLDPDQPTRADVVAPFTGLNALPVAWIDPADVTAAVLWLAGGTARHVTGTQLPVDAGALL
ncbi:mycofactocin-coupled SDR family oxidoreductase [Klenkia sp. LSe6-5]|uniref:Mycofactocin-coupled SDR family oxidoreductase n=1 Tax=Klenkia sesuvii TaxID=3103137 RepID=A0ABU8DUV1_9ACTN